MTKISGINLNEQTENFYEETNGNKKIIIKEDENISSNEAVQANTQICTKNFEEILSLIKEYIINFSQEDNSDENKISPQNKDMKILVENDTGKIQKIENYQIQINVISDNIKENDKNSIAFDDYMSIISSLNKMMHNIV